MSRGRKRKYPLVEMLLGERIVIPYPDNMAPDRFQKNVCTAMARVSDRRFKTTQQRDGVQVRRVE